MRSRPVLLLVAILGVALVAYLAGRAALRGSASAPRVQTDSALGGEDVQLESEAEHASKPDTLRAPTAGTPAVAPEPETRIDGLVVRPDGKPAALARVRYLLEQFEDSTVTDEQGRFTIEPAPVGHLRLVALHDDFAESAWVDCDVAGGERKRDLRLVLRDFARIHGVVLDAHNVARAKVSVVCEDMDSGKAYFSESDGAGRFEFAKVTPGSEVVSVKLSAQELSEIRADVPYLANRLAGSDQEQRVEVAEGQTVEIVLGGIPAGGVRVFGTVSSGGTKLPSTWVWAETAEGFVNPRARTDEHGKYELWVPATGEYDFQIAGASGGLHLARQESITGEREQRVDFDVPGGTLAGHVVDVSGRPVPGVQVTLEMQGQVYDAQPDSYIPYVPFCTAGADGRFAFVHLPAGSYELHAEHVSTPDAESEFARASLRDLALASGASIRGIEIVLTPGCTIRGAVRGAPEGFGGHLFYVSAYDEGGRVVVGARADAEGGFVLRGLVEGSYGVAARAGYLLTPVCDPVRVRSDHEPQVELTVVRGSRLRVATRCPPGEHPGAIDVSILDERRNQVSSWLSSGDDPGFTSSFLAPGTYRVECTGAGGWSGAETVLIGADVEARVEVALRHPK